jgi:hypothetical protein
MASYRMTNVGFEDAKAVFLADDFLSIGKGGVPVCSVVRTVISRDQVANIDADSVESIVVTSASLEWVVSGVLSNGIYCMSVHWRER